MKLPFLLLTPIALAALLSVQPSAQAQKPATPESGTGTTATRSADTSTDYRLVAGDKLRIEVYKDAQLSQSLQVRPDCGRRTVMGVG